MWTDPNINSAMGLQATAATKRKHEITFDSKDANTYTNCPPPVKTSRWSSNAAAQTTTTTTTPTINHNNNNTSSNNYNNEPSTVAPTTTATTIILGNSSSTNSNSSSAPTTATVAGAAAGPGAATTTGANLIKNSGNCDENKVFNNAPSMPATAAATTSNGNPVTTATSNCATSSVALSSSSSASEDSIAKLEVVAAVPCEPWHTSEPVDCISKLQAVAVPSDPWGSISTRSTLATTLLSTDEMDDDDDDFEDDYEEEESIIPTYCPLRYHPCPPASNGNNGANGPAGGGNPGPGAGGNPAAMQRNYSPANGYNTRPNYYSEPFPQQNCSRTGNQHLRMAPNAGFAPQWGNSAAQSQNGFYVPPEAAYPPPQQTIRCAENGKSYLELGCSPTSFSSLSNQNGVSSMVNGVNGNSNGMDTRHPLKRCCDGRAGTWCNTNKNCYKDVRLKIRNLSMFKLSRFRQVSEQSLYRSVLICNTLKYIDREIESEAKEMHQQQQQHHLNHPHHPHQSHLHHHVPHHGSNHHHHHHNSHHHHHQQQQQQQQQQQHLQHQQNLQHQQQSNNANGDYSPAMGCARVTTLDYHQIQHQQQQQQQQQHNQFHSQQQAADNRNGDCTQQQSSYMNAMSKSSLFHNQPHQHPHQQHPQPQQQQQQQHHQQLQHPHCNSGDSLHPYDHYPFRESQSGRATPFPTIPSPVSPTPVTPVSNTTTTSDNDSGYGEDDSNRSINWSSVLSLSSQSALDPLNNNDLFTILPPATSSTSPPAATPVSLNSSSVSISGTFTASSVQSNNNSGSVSSTSSSLTSPLSSSTPTTFTTLSTISSSTYSLTSSSASSFASAAAAAASTWEYGFLDMDFGLGSEFTELVPSCKLSSDDLFKSVSPVSALSASRYSSVHDNELEHPAHIMVGS
ncbi:transcription factor mef2A isoform X2 [Episyrphus balteatus]|uniref:transcription factor mef2A isoform X2 n=1 Tax=Episyrphus balteatus TaxID=286459 RepID=UPI002484FA0B|nr:transcription factor mef2A isoform X2 [Episyrphus balteatus]